MSKTHDEIDQFITDRILNDNFENIMGDRFGRYSKYIIQDRALPDVRDGLKPVQRRILFAMFKLGLASNKPFKKSARIVGDVIGKYHPHGDTSVYDAMVRMSQDFKILLPLIDMHGNNGSIDGDPAAAMRYTEARMSKYAELMLEDLNKKTVGFVPNFDDEELEPVVLPSKFPNILVNGASGISAGYATEIPPHNPVECIEAAIYKMNHRDATLDDLLNIVKGPDFPTGGIVQGFENLKQAYTTGKGKVILKSKATIEHKSDCHQIIITEIPYEVNKANLLRKMSDQLQAKNVDGVKMIRDESDRLGLRIVIDVRKDADPEVILNFLYLQTELQINYNFNMVAISRGKPCYMGLMDFIDAYIDHQRDVLRNRCNFDYDRAVKRLEVVKGLIDMVSILDAVIATIRNSKNKADAKENLISKYGFTELQAEAIVMLQLYRLTNTDIVALKDECADLEKEINYLNEILNSNAALNKAIIKELERIKEEVNVLRKTVIEHEISNLEVYTEDFIPKEDVFVLVSHDGYLKRISKRAFGGEKEFNNTKVKDGDVITDVYSTTTTDTLISFTNFGNYIFLPIHKIPDCKHKDIGFNASTLITMEPNEKILFSFVVNDFNADKYVLLATKKGFVKRIKISSLEVSRYSKALKATKLSNDDEVVSVDLKTGLGGEVVVCTAKGYTNRYDADAISVMEPSSFGVKAIELKSRPDDYVVGLKFADPKDIIAIMTNRGHIKRIRPNEVEKHGKNTAGKMTLKVVKSNPHTAVSMEVIHHGNNNSDAKIYAYCLDKFFPVEYTELKNMIADNGMKIVPEKDPETKKPLTPVRIVILRNDDDIE